MADKSKIAWTDSTMNPWLKCTKVWNANRVNRGIPSIHMPRWASRITLEITRIRVERLHEITEADARAEGFPLPEGMPANITITKAITHKVRRHQGTVHDMTALEGFQRLWDALNKKRGFGWDTNPWVWVVEFKRLKGLST